MRQLRNLLLHEITRSHPEWPCAATTLSRLEHFGKDLIPGLISCLLDQTWETRHFAVCLLAEARPYSDVAVTEIIKCLADDERLVRAIALHVLEDFGALAVDAIPYLETWLDLENDDYLRIRAVVLLMHLAPSRTEFLADIREATNNTNSIVSDVALNYLAKVGVAIPFNQRNFRFAVQNGWFYTSPCESFDWYAECRQDGIWYADASPVIQEVWGGKDDGKLTWADFDFHHSWFAEQPGVLLETVETTSRYENNVNGSHTCLRGRYFGEPFELRVHLEPVPGSETKEILDTLSHSVRCIVVERDTLEPESGDSETD